MPRSRSRKKRAGRRDGASRRGPSDSVVLLDLLNVLDPASIRESDGWDDEDAAGLPDEFDLPRDLGAGPDSDLFVLEVFDRAAWSFHGGPGLEYAGDAATERSLARLRAREWFLFEFELPSGLTTAEEWLDEHAGEPGSAADRRAIRRFLDSECGVFDVREVGRDGSMVLSPIDGSDSVRARTIDRAVEMVPGPKPILPVFKTGDTIAGRLYWQDRGNAHLSAGACLVSKETRARIVSDPPAARELRSGLGLEAALGADASSLFDHAPSPCFPHLVDSLLWSVSDGTFDYPRLWRELEGEPDPVAVSRQLLSEIEPATDSEPQVVAWAVAGTWLRRVEARAGRRLTSGVLARDRRVIEEHVHTVLDVPGDADLRRSAPPLAIRDEEIFARIDELAADEVEWIVDVLPDPRRLTEPPAFTPDPLMPACLIVEQPITLSGALEEDDELDDEEDAGDEVDWQDEDEGQGDEGEEPGAAGKRRLPGQPDESAPLVLQHVTVNEGDDPAAVALAALVETLLAEGRETRPARIVFRQRAVAARLADTLHDAGFDVQLRYFDEATDLATLDLEDLAGPPRDAEEGPPRDAEEGPPRDAEAGPPLRGGRSTVAATESERRAYERLVDAARRAEGVLHELAANTDARGEIMIGLGLARALAYPFATWEGLEDHVGAMAVFVEGQAESLLLRVHLAAPGQESRFECRTPAGEPIVGSADTVQLELVRANDRAVPPPLQAARFIARDEGARLVVVPLRYRGDAPAELLRGRHLEVAAGVMEAVAAAGVRMIEEGEEGAVEVTVEPLGDVRVSWRAWM